MNYFVCFCYEREGKVDIGNAGIEMDGAITKYGDIGEMERRLEKICGIDHPIVLNYKPLRGAAPGEAEAMKVSGNDITLKSRINVSIGNDKGSGRAAGEIAEAMRKLLISQMQE